MVSPCCESPASSSVSLSVAFSSLGPQHFSEAPVVPASFWSERFNQTGEKAGGDSSFLSDSALRSADF